MQCKNCLPKLKVTWKAKIVRTNTIAVVMPAAIMTASVSYIMLTKERVTASPSVNAVSNKKFSGKLLQQRYVGSLLGGFGSLLKLFFFM